MVERQLSDVPTYIPLCQWGVGGEGQGCGFSLVHQLVFLGLHAVLFSISLSLSLLSYSLLILKLAFTFSGGVEKYFFNTEFHLSP